MLFYTMIHGMSIGSLRMSDLKSCYKRPKPCALFQQNVFCMGWEPSHASLDALHQQVAQLSQPHFEGSVRSPFTLPKMGLGSPLGLPKI